MSVALSDPLKKAAILVASLDAESADALLEHVEPELAARIRNAVMQLEAVDPDQQQHVIQEFVNRSPTGAVDVAAGVELDQSLARKLAAEVEQTPDRIAAAEKAAVPFASLHAVEPHVLTDLLIREHPQTIGIVAAYLPPQHAAEILRRLPEHLQTEVLMRIARLNDPAPEIIRDLESEMESLLANRRRSTQATPVGARAVAAILHSSNDAERERWVARLAEHDGLLSCRLATDQLDPETMTELRSMAGLEARNGAPKLPAHSKAVAKGNDACSDAMTFADFEQLDDELIARVLAAADPKLTLIALAGASRSLVQRIMCHLAPSQASALDRQMQGLGPIRLDDIERAQLHLAKLAMALHAPAPIPVTPTHRFVVAA